jgi:hypothetical protein
MVRIDYRKVFPDALQAMIGLEGAVHASSLEPEEVVALTLAIVAINGWNRFAVGLRSPVGGYVSPHAHAGEEVAR